MLRRFLSTMARNRVQPQFYERCGAQITKDQYLQSLESFPGQVIFLGENHMDPSAHALELEVLQRLKHRKLRLSLEFYDRQAQPVLDEYLQGFISEETFLHDARAPANYQPLVNFCQANHIPVVAANCPRRYTKFVSQRGRDELAALVQSCPQAQAFLPPLPYEGASEKYTDKFVNVMRSMGNESPRVPTSMLDAQSLWDATMAHSIVQALKECDLVVHVTGYFHIKQGLGTLEHLDKYSEGQVQSLTTVILPEDNPNEFSADDHAQMADFVVLTDLAEI